MTKRIIIFALISMPVCIPAQDHLSLGIPGSADTVISREGYALGFVNYHKQPAWVIYHLTAEKLRNPVTSRSGSFRADPEIPFGSATPADYLRSGYDRGHLAPAADMKWSRTAMTECFYMSNMSPQAPAFNRGIWKDLEAQVRQFAINEHDVYIVTGPILPKFKTITIGTNAVTVPEAFYKVVYDVTPPQKMIAFIVPNAACIGDLRSFTVTVDLVEALTGLDFFSNLPDELENELESTITVKDWIWIPP